MHAHGFSGNEPHFTAFGRFSRRRSLYACISLRPEQRAGTLPDGEKCMRTAHCLHEK